MARPLPEPLGENPLPRSRTDQVLANGGDGRFGDTTVMVSDRSVTHHAWRAGALKRSELCRPANPTNQELMGSWRPGGR